MNRRGFLGAILATGIAPAIGKAEWLMKGRVLVPEWVNIPVSFVSPEGMLAAMYEGGPSVPYGVMNGEIWNTLGKIDWVNGPFAAWAPAADLPHVSRRASGSSKLHPENMLLHHEEKNDERSEQKPSEPV